MKTAFGRAMMDALKDPSVEFFMRSQLYASGASCAPYLTLRTEEEQLIASLALPSQSRVLDFGCGLGRHLKAIAQMFPDAHLVGVEKCDLLRQHCQENIDGALIYASLDELEGQKFDLILLMGNGLGISGQKNKPKLAWRE